MKRWHPHPLTSPGLALALLTAWAIGAVPALFALAAAALGGGQAGFTEAQAMALIAAVLQRPAQ